MTMAFQVARTGAVVALLTAVVFAVLPPASVLDNSTLTIPDIIWDPLVAVLGLNRYLPVSELVVVAGLTLAIQAGMAMFWLVSWIMRHVMGS